MVRSEGCEDKGRGPGCGIASININGQDYSKHKRGYNLVVLDGSTGMSSVQSTFMPKFSCFFFQMNQFVFVFCNTTPLNL